MYRIEAPFCKPSMTIEEQLDVFAELLIEFLLQDVNVAASPA
ncbi:hypothetical protein [Flaviaesturariibacter flavus]|nr:hypothetical protein [Flaviaesturariibacter flavus]